MTAVDVQSAALLAWGDVVFREGVEAARKKAAAVVADETASAGRRRVAWEFLAILGKDGDQTHPLTKGDLHGKQ